MTLGENSDQALISKLKQLTLDHLEDERFGGKELALAMGMSWSTLNRKVQAITGRHISELIREIRLKKALELLQDNNTTAGEVAFRVGFGSPAYFSKCFNDFFGFPPGEVKKKLAEGSLPLLEEPQAGDESIAETAEPSSPTKFSKPYRMAAFAGIALLILALGIVFLAKKGNLIYLPGGQEKSIAVLPFKNMSPEADNQYFADGITEDILNHLFRISELRVISRTTAERFRDSELPSTEIAKSMGVNYLLEGSVRKQGGQVRINVQLIDGKRDHHLWAENYDRQLADIFFIQSDIAQNVARELRTVLSTGELQKLEAAKTRILEAYDFYLRGRDYQNRGFKEDDFRFAMQMYQKAVEIDPDFALAWAGLAACSRDLYWFNIDKSEENLLKTKLYLDKALSLAPALKEVRLEEAVYYYYCELDYLKSIELLKRLKTEYPNNDEIVFWLAMVYRRMGEFEKSLEYNNLAISLNPSFWNYWSNSSHTFRVLKDYKKAEEYMRNAIDLNPSNSTLHNSLFNIYIRSGQKDKAKDFLVLNEKNFDAQDFLWYKAELEFFSRNYSKAIHLTKSISEEEILSHDEAFLKHLQLGIIYRTVSDSAMAIRHFEFARDFYFAKIKESENDWLIYGSLGMACAGLGLREESIEAGQKSINMFNIKVDAYMGIITEMNMVRILILLEEYDEALIMLDRIIDYTGNIITVEELMFDPFWDPVREHPKFQEIINNPEYQVSL